MYSPPFLWILRISEWNSIYSTVKGVKGNEMCIKGVVGCVVVSVILCWGWGAQAVAEAGELKVHEWPTSCRCVAQSICTLDIIIDVGYFIDLLDQEFIIVGPDRSTGDPLHTYAGYKESEVVANYPATLSVSISPIGTDVGQWSASVAPKNIPSGTSSIKIYVQGKDVGGHILNPDGPTRVAVVTLSVAPQ